MSRPGNPFASPRPPSSPYAPHAEADKLTAMELTLINTNRMTPPIAPLGLAYVAAAARAAGHGCDVLDLSLAPHPDQAARQHFARHAPDLVGLSFRNVDDCFWPSATSFVSGLVGIVAAVRELTDAPIVLGGVGYSIFAKRLLLETGADFGVGGDGEAAIVQLLAELAGQRRFENVSGLAWRGADGAIVANAPAWPDELHVPTARDVLDNAAYFRLGGQGGVETKRGCPRCCSYCADPLAKGPRARLRPPADVADEIASLADQGVDMLHICDGEFNMPASHAKAVCDELIARRLGARVRWYAYMAVTPFDAHLAQAMRRAGCVGIDFTGDSASDVMLQSYGQPHRVDDLAHAVTLCRDNGITVMVDLLLGGPGETPETLAESIDALKLIDPDCVGAGLGLRIYPGTPAAARIAAEGPLEHNPAIRRRTTGPVDLLFPTFYISAALGPNPASLVRDLIAGDGRFFPPAEDCSATQGDHNYNDNADLARAIANGKRGAYWHILHEMNAT